MSVNTLVKDGTLHNLNVTTKLFDLKLKKGVVHYNPGICRDPEGKIYISIRSCITDYKKYNDITHPLGYENFLHVGFLDEDKMEIKDLKLIEPEAEYEGFQWGIEDIRLFWREDGLHGVGVIIPLEGRNLKLRQAEILIDYEKSTFKLLKDLGRPFGHAEKNWSPTEAANPHFDYIYSPTQIVKDGEVIGEPNDLFIHNGTPLIPYENGYISIGHSVISVNGERTYGQIALKWSDTGELLEHSQFFHFGLGWREQLQETIEFVSGMIWSKGKEGEELLMGIGIKDELTGLAKVPISKFKWERYSDTTWYAWRWAEPQKRIEIFA